MYMKTKQLLVILALLTGALTVGGPAALFAQAADRANYVDVEDGSDDNNGRSVDKAFKTLNKAIDTAKRTAVKKIVLVKSLYYGGGTASDTGDAEILVTSLDSTVVLSKVMINGKGKSNLRFENLRMEGSSGIVGYDGAKIVVGKGCQIPTIRVSDDNTMVTIESNAQVAYKYLPDRDGGSGGEGIVIEGGKVLVQDEVIIAGFDRSGITMSGGELTVQDNVQIHACTGGGMHISAGKMLLKDNVTISGNTKKGYDNDNGGGISITGGDVTIQDNVAITNNTAENFGGGLFLEKQSESHYYSGEHITVHITGNVQITNNTAKYGGGIYSGGSMKNYYDEYNFSTSHAVQDWSGPEKQKTISIAGNSITVEGNTVIKDNKATEGGGIYVAEGSVMTTCFLDAVKKTGTITQRVGGFVMKSGTISGNKADYGAGVYVAAEELSIPEQEVVSKKDPYGVEFIVKNTGKQIDKATFTFTGGSITGNAAELVGGGIYVKDKGAYGPGIGTAAGSVTGNSAGDGEGEDVYRLTE
jgi:predicted outer membrane repeat protein